MLGALSEGKDRPPCRLQDMTRSGEDLACCEERNQMRLIRLWFKRAFGGIVLVAPIGIPCAVEVVLQQVDRSADSLVSKTLFCRFSEFLKDSLARTIVDDCVPRIVALSCCVFRMRTDVEVETRAILEKDV